MSDTEDLRRPTIALAAVTAWADDGPVTFDPVTLTSRDGAERRLDDLPSDAVVWLDMDLEGVSATEWLEPWHPPEAGTVAWEKLRGVSDTLGFGLPDSAGPEDPVAVGLDHLVVINEMWRLRWLERRLGALGHDYVAAPLVGFIPTFEPGPGVGPLELIVLRVDLLVIGRLILTIRSPDLVYRGSVTNAPDDTRYHRRPNLTVFAHHLPSGGVPTPREVGDALALYLSATCWSVAEHARAMLYQVDRAGYPRAGADTSDADLVKSLFGLSEATFEIVGTLRLVGEELLREVDRLSEAPRSRSRLPTHIRSRYERGLEELRAVQRDALTLIDALSGRAGRYQQELTRRRDRRQDRLQILLATVGVVPPLVATMFADDVKFGGQAQGSARLGMVLIMGGSALLGLSIVLLALGVGRHRRRSRRLVDLLALGAVVVGGIGVRVFVS